MKRVQAHGEHVIVRLLKPHREYQGPLVLPDDIQPDTMGVRMGEVVSVGRGKTNDRGVFVPTELKVGDVVLIDQIATRGWWPKVDLGEDGHDYHAIPEHQILGVVEGLDARA